MSDPIDVGEDDGFIDVTIGTVRQTLDLYSLNNALFEAQERAENGTERGKAFVAVLKSHGFPDVSTRYAFRFADAVFERMAALTEESKKKEGAAESASSTPSSPDSTGSAS